MSGFPREELTISTYSIETGTASQAESKAVVHHSVIDAPTDQLVAAKGIAYMKPSGNFLC